MKFEEALSFMRNTGLKVRRKIWTSAYIFIGTSVDDQGKFQDTIYCGNAVSDQVYRIKSFDMSCILSDDWEVV